MTNREYLNSISYLDAMIILIAQNTQVEHKINQSVRGSNIRNRLCQKYDIDPNDRDQYRKLQIKMLLEWLDNDINNKDDD